VLLLRHQDGAVKGTLKWLRGHREEVYDVPTTGVEYAHSPAPLSHMP
jgi:hypothetical protein